MRLTSLHTFEIPSYGRSISDEAWEIIELEQISIWESAIKLLRVQDLKLDNCTINIEADWTPILRKHEQHYAVMKRLSEGVRDGDEALSISKGFPSGKAKVEFSAEVIGDQNNLAKAHVNLASCAIESYLHDFFLILNVCAPGSCDFYRATLSGKSSPTDISLSNVQLEIALLGSFKKNWPAIKTLDLPQALRWFRSIRTGISQLPHNPMEKVLFALLHVSKLDMTPMIVIWLFYAFESLLQTKVGENLSSMINRLIALLELDEQQSKILRGKFRTLYDIRSAIVHGGFEVTHPMHNEILDKRVDENYEKLSGAAEYGLTALIAGVQNTIIRGWKYPNFTEKMQGIPVEG